MKKLISIVVPVYNDESNIKAVYSEIKKTFKGVNQLYNLEIIFVDDGSGDGSLKELKEISSKDKSVITIRLSRNFGHQIALTAGLDYSNGQAVVTMDSDLQDPPKVILRMLDRWEKGYEVVYAQRRSRPGDSLSKRISSKLFYQIINKLSTTPTPKDVGEFRLMDKKVVSELKKFRESHRFLRGLVNYVGFSQTLVLFDRQSRKTGATSYSFRKRWELALDGITGFSTTPIKLISRVGFFVSFLSLVGIIYVVSVKFFDPARAVPGWAFVAVSIFFIGGVQLLMLGILGSYIARIYTQSQERPLYIVDTVYKKNSPRKSRA